MMADQHSSRRPDKTFRARGVQASVWANPLETEDGTVTRYSVKIDKLYRDNDGTVRSSSTFFPQELAALRAVVDRAIDYCLVEESEDITD